MSPVMRGTDYAAIERRAHELRREAMSEMFEGLSAWIAGKVHALQDVAASVLLRQRRSADATFFEAQ
jgi:hypothetical protein